MHQCINILIYINISIYTWCINDIAFTYCINQFLLLNTLPFLFSQTLLLIKSISFSLELRIFWQLPSCFRVSSYFFFIFWIF